MYGRHLPSPNRHQPKTPAQDSVGARVVGMGGEGLYGRPLLVCDPVGQQEIIKEGGRP